MTMLLYHKKKICWKQKKLETKEDLNNIQNIKMRNIKEFTYSISEKIKAHIKNAKNIIEPKGEDPSIINNCSYVVFLT